MNDEDEDCFPRRKSTKIQKNKINLAFVLSETRRFS